MKHAPLHTAPASAEKSAQTLSRRTLLGRGAVAGLGLSVAGSALLAACGNDRSSTKGLVRLTFAAYQDTTGFQAAAVKAFNDTYAGKIQVTLTELPTAANDQLPKFQNVFNAQSSEYDVVQVSTSWPAQFAAAGWLEPLNRYANAAYLKPFFPAATTIANYKDKLYGIQRFMDVGLFYYRTDLVQKYGGVIPTTRDQLVSLSQQIVAGESANGVNFGYLFAGKKIDVLTHHWLETLYGDGGTWGTPGNLVVNGPKQIAALQFQHDLIYQQKLTPAATNTYDNNAILNLFGQGKAPFMRNWTYAYASLSDPTKSQVAGKFNVAPLFGTSGNQGHGSIGGWVLSISAFSQHKDEAWTFIDYLLSLDTQKQMALKASLIPARGDAITASDVAQKAPQLTAMKSSLDSAIAPPLLAKWTAFTSVLNTTINTVLSDQQSPSDALNAAQSQVASLK